MSVRGLFYGSQNNLPREGCQLCASLRSWRANEEEDFRQFLLGDGGEEAIESFSYRCSYCCFII